MMEPALQLALHGTAYRTGAVTSARRVLMSYELDGCAGDWQGPPWPAKGRQTGPFAADRAALGLDRFVSLPPSMLSIAAIAESDLDESRSRRACDAVPCRLGAPRASGPPHFSS